MAWKAFTEHFDKMGNQEVYIQTLSATINKPYKYHPEGIIGWIQEKEQAYSEMEGITKYSIPDDLKKSTLLQLLRQHGSEWWRGQSQELNFTEACNFIRGQCLTNKHNFTRPP